jgi:hypothetical protein
MTYLTRGTLRRTVPSSHQFGFVGQGGTRRAIDRPLDASGSAPGHHETTGVG